LFHQQSNYLVTQNEAFGFVSIALIPCKIIPVLHVAVKTTNQNRFNLKMASAIFAETLDNSQDRIECNCHSRLPAGNVAT
jgi:hypothetical protein